MRRRKEGRKGRAVLFAPVPGSSTYSIQPDDVFMIQAGENEELTGDSLHIRNVGDAGFGDDFDGNLLELRVASEGEGK